ncbi:oxygen-dependent protoporphyrinogen oxidase [Aurantimicrobium minutum]|uniref:protoporphyrinogen/coproporphyrinogen oxidase n=1 Tax=Aurantimicrobium minutum TaxID=708131 RepID=UPI002405CDD6|nr:FAD-dependent oxidoreductase [Aurantimicrobium minutum]MDF9809806.1 oxygen-dependent protoporphyrinogen oxidase [Aurantimicrobium minutum]
MMDADRIIIGAGIAGLLAARRAVSRGESVLVLDQQTQSGGLVASTRVNDIDLDTGAEAFSVAEDSCLKLIEELELENAVVYPQRSDARIIYSATQRYRIPHGVLGIPSSLYDPELEDIISAEALEQARLLDQASLFNLENVTVAELVVKRLGPEFLEKLVDPVIAGVHGSSASNLLVRTTIPALSKAMQQTGSICEGVSVLRSSQPRPGAAVASLEGGLFRLIQALELSLRVSGVRFRFEVSVSALAQSDQGWEIESPSRTYRSRFISVCTGIAPALKLFSSLSQTDSSDINHSSVDVALVVLEVESAELNSFPLGSGALVSEKSSVLAKATTHVNAKWEWVEATLPSNHHLIRFSYGRDGVVPSGVLGEFAATDLQLAYGVSDARILNATTILWPGSLFQANPAARASIDDLQERATQWGIELCGSYLSGNGLLGITRDHYLRNAS